MLSRDFILFLIYMKLKRFIRKIEAYGGRWEWTKEIKEKSKQVTSGDPI